MYKGEYGLVVSDGEVDSETDPDEDEDQPRRKPGHAGVMFLEHSDELPERELTIVDREFLHGDVVKRAVPGSLCDEIGVVVGVNMLLDVKVVEGKMGVIKGIPSTQCDFVHPYTYGTYVVKNGCVGAIIDSRSKLNISFPGDLLCEMDEAATENLEPISLSPNGEQEDVQLYPGLQFRGSKKAWKDAKGLKEHLNKHLIQGVLARFFV